MANEQNLNRNGRPKGSLNKVTKERNELFREMILNSGAIRIAFDVMLNRIKDDSESVKMADLVKFMQMLTTYTNTTLKEELDNELKEAVISSDNTEEMKQNILDFFKTI